MGTRAELKNLNSFKFVRDALTEEIARQVAVLEEGGEVAQETRTYDPKTGKTRTMRSKEEAEDYRYFPEPDLPPLRLNPQLDRSHPRLHAGAAPGAAHPLPVKALELSEYEANVLGGDPVVADLLRGRRTSAWTIRNAWPPFLMGELVRELNDVGGDIDQCRTTPRDVAELLDLEKEGTINRATAKELFVRMFKEGGRPVDLVEDEGLAQVSDAGELEEIVAAVLEENADKVDRIPAAARTSSSASSWDRS